MWMELVNKEIHKGKYFRQEITETGIKVVEGKLVRGN